ncbi:peptidyl-alpha-hydroxyglycine alpha-amidating lyase family protein [Chloroflexota bacterium]
MSYGTDKYTYELVDRWAKLPEGWSFMDVCGITVDSQDRVYVVNRSGCWGRVPGHPVMVFDCEGNLLTTWGEGFFKRTHGGYASPDDSIYIADDYRHVVCKFTLEGKLLLTLGNIDHPSDTGYVKYYEPSDDPESKIRSGGSVKSVATIRGGPPFNRPTNAALDPTGEIYVSDGYGNCKVHKFSSDGTLLLSWGEPGTSTPGQFNVVHDVWVDKQEYVYVADRENNRVQIFNSEGEFLSQWTDVTRPNGIFMDDEGVVYIAEGKSKQSARTPGKVSIWTSDGKLLARWQGSQQEEIKESPLFGSPHTIAVDSRGDIYVGENYWTNWRVDQGSRAVQKFVRKV